VVATGVLSFKFVLFLADLAIGCLLALIRKRLRIGIVVLELPCVCIHSAVVPVGRASY
jgi:hypothetical protein